MDFDRLDGILKERHISRRKLAIAVGIPESTMSTAFMRRSGLSFMDTLKIAKFLDADPYWLEGWEPAKGKNGALYYTKNGHYITPGYPRPDSPEFNHAAALHDDINKENASISDAVETKKVRMNYAFDKLNNLGQQKAVEYVIDLSENPKYTKPDSEQEE